MEVEEPRGRSAPEPVNDSWRNADAPAGAERVFLVVDEERDLASQDVERIRVSPVHVGLRTGASAREP
jgi:hypothetical protein